MKKIKYLILVMMFLVNGSINLYAQHVAIEIIPNEPSIENEVVAIAHVSFFTASEYQHHQIDWLDDFNIHIDMFYLEGLQSMTSYHRDSVFLGQLPAGTYTIIADLRVIYGTGNLEDLSSYSKKDSDTITFRVSETLDNLKHKKENLHLFIHPNPVTDMINLTLNFDEIADVQLEILDIQGKSITTQKSDNYSQGEHIFSINVSNLSKGLYLLKVTSGERMTTKKFIKQ